MEVKLASFLERLEPDIGTNVIGKGWRNIQYEFRLTAPSGQSPSIDIRPATESQSAQVRLSVGTLSLSSSDPTLSSHTFDAPVCLSGGSSNADNPLLDSIQVTTCQ
jgi:hypothetical protein